MRKLKGKKITVFTCVFRLVFNSLNLLQVLWLQVVTSFEICFVVVLLTLNVQNALLHTWYFTKIKLVAVKNIG